MNSLGATETLTFRWNLIDRETPFSGTNVPVGYAVDDMEVLLLDDAGKEIGFDQIGEIAVKSRYLSPGYWRKPELTAAAFSSAPGEGGKRIYRTGDLGRMLWDGSLEHLGRKDFQVKIRGRRVETAEIELALLRLEAIKEAVVTAREYARGDLRIVAYIVPRTRPRPTVDALRRALRERLPDAMIPSAFVLLDALPLTSNGKVDRRALPVPDQARPPLGNPFVEPRDEIERALAKIWSQILRIERVGVHDDFFDLGGDSLLATQIISRVRDVFRVEVQPRTLFDAPTVAGIGEVIRRAGKDAAIAAPKIAPAARRPEPGKASL